MTEEVISEEIQLDDGLPPNDAPPEMTELPEMNPSPEEPEASSTTYSADVFTEAEFYEAFKAAFGVAGELTGTKSLAIKDNEELGASYTAHKLYELGQSSPYFRWLIEKTGWLKDAMIIGTFVYMKTDAVLQEKQGKGLKEIVIKRVKSWRNRNKPSIRTRLGSVFSGRAEAEKAIEDGNL